MSAGEDDRLARVALSRLGEPGDPRLLGLVERLGAPAVLDRLRAQVAHEPVQEELRSNLAQRLDGLDPATELARATELGLRFVVPGDPEWPASMADLARAPVLHARTGVPVGLWLKGPLRLDEAVEHAVAVVGSRSATSYGTGIAGDVAHALAEAHYTVVSGAAFGIDQAAHRGALAARGPTLAVLACGADRVYPSAHRALIDYVAQTGLVVSEAAPGGAPTRIRFLARNRLIAALTRGTLVVEAAVRSGALNTASWAAGLGRTVMAVPGPVTSAPSAGAHQLIRSKDALLVTNGAEVLEAVGPIGTFLLAEPREESRPRDLLDDVQRQVLDAVPVRQGATTDSVARTAGVARAGVAVALARLQQLGLVERAGDLWRLGAGSRPEDRVCPPEDRSG